MAVCKFCGKETVGASSCAECLVIIDGEKFQPIPHRNDCSPLLPRGALPSRCAECNVMPGGLHHIGCGVEICPKCRNRWISCRCAGFKRQRDPAGPSPGRGKIIPLRPATPDPR